MDNAPATERVAYSALLVAFTAFRDGRVREICSGDHGCRETLQGERSTVDASFLRLAEGNPPDSFPASASTDPETADAALNES